MPKALERKLRRRASKKFRGNKKRQNAYIYGALRASGWKPKRKRSKKRGRRAG